MCVATYKRLKGLERLIVGLSELAFSGDPPYVEIIVVDNDADGSAMKVCEELRERSKWPLRCVVESRRGIPFARNRAIECAGEGFDYIAFIDDDEVPQPRWLDELLCIREVYNADVVTGPVLPRFEGDVPRWIVKGKFFDRRRYITGTPLVHAFTGNVLIRCEIFSPMEGLFDERMALTGGSDRHFFRRVARAGFKIVWADDAIVHEWIPQSRTCFKWLVQRFFRVGNAASWIELDLTPSWSTCCVLAAKGVVWIALGALLAPCGLLGGFHVFVRGARYVAYGAGMLSGLLGGRYEEYKETHGA